MVVRLVILSAALGACAHDPNDVLVQLSPDVVSSLDGQVAVHALLLADRDPVSGKAIELTIDYTDRNGTAHAVAPIDGKTDEKGAFDGTFEGLQWDGTGTVHAAVGTLTGDATFAVLDRTPPKVSITAPANNSVRTQTTTPIAVHVSDEIGISRVSFEVDTGNAQFPARTDSTVLASGSIDAMVSFDLSTENIPAGTMLTLYALASDLSSNEAAATAVKVAVTQ